MATEDLFEEAETLLKEEKYAELDSSIKTIKATLLLNKGTPKDKQRLDDLIEKKTRAQLLESKEPIHAEHNTIEILQNSLQQLKEAEEDGKSALSNLKQQGEQLQKINGNIKETQSNLRMGNSLLNKMKQWWRG
jgi:prefoldin subunit 5